MKLTWYGHSSFLIESAQGTRILTDPYPQSIFKHELVPCDAVSLSHKHYDHADLTQVVGKPLVIEGLAPTLVGDIRVYGVPSFHDPEGGALRGANTVYVFECDGMRLAHLGDLGTQLDPEQLSAIGVLDAVLVPVGGTYTLDPAEAARLVRSVNPHLVIPMHYAMEGHSFPLKTVHDFLAALAATPAPDKSCACSASGTPLVIYEAESNSWWTLGEATI